MTAVTSKRSLSISPYFVMHVIKSQAGSLAKAVTESVANSCDAGATSIQITTSGKGFTITDNGRGFKSKEEIEAFFEVLGFDHTGLDRTVGQFGVGRAQTWAFARTVWFTGEFAMRVDVEKSGLNYDLVEGLEPVQGLRIEAELYEPMRTSDLLAFERELADLCEYSPVQVVLNQQVITKDASAEKWSHETPDALIKLSDSSRELKVYNLGFLVRSYPSYAFGVGGIVVSKSQMMLNVARSDVLQSKCEVFKRIKPFLQSRADERVSRSVKLTEDQMSNLAMRYIAGDVKHSEIASRRLISDMRGARLTLRAFLEKAFCTSKRTVTVIQDGERVATAEQSHRMNECFVLSAATLARFGVDSVTSLLQAFAKCVERDRLHIYSSRGVVALKEVKAADDWKDVCAALSTTHLEIPRDMWSKEEEAAMEALGDAEHAIRLAVEKAGVTVADYGGALAPRRLLLGESETAEAWTDGSTKIVLNRKLLRRLRNGLGGTLSVVAIMVHEFLHESESTSTHAHDAEFFERFERVLSFEGAGVSGFGTIGAATETLMRSYARRSAKLSKKLSSKALASLDAVEGAVLEAEAQAG